LEILSSKKGNFEIQLSKNANISNQKFPFLEILSPKKEMLKSSPQKILISHQNFLFWKFYHPKKEILLSKKGKICLYKPSKISFFGNPIINQLI